MFKIADKRTVEWPVLIAVPQDGGKVRKFEARVEFEYLQQSEVDEALNGGNETDLMMRAVKGWPDGQFQDETGANLPFTPENLARLLQIQYVRMAFVAAHLQLQQGREAARKN
jgi:hypothetical protein